MKIVLLTVLACLAVELAGGVGFIYSGLYDVAAVNPDNPVVAWAVHSAGIANTGIANTGIATPAAGTRPAGG